MTKQKEQLLICIHDLASRCVELEEDALAVNLIVLYAFAAVGMEIPLAMANKTLADIALDSGTYLPLVNLPLVNLPLVKKKEDVS